MGPIAFFFLLVLLASHSVWSDRRLGFLAAMTSPFLALIAFQALLAKANMNWAAPAYFGGSLLVAAYWAAGNSKRWCYSAIATNLIFLACFYHYHALADMAGIKLNRHTDPYVRLLGWPQLGSELSKVVEQYPDFKVAVVRRDEFSLLGYYAGLYPERLRIWNPESKRQNHFHLFSDMKQDMNQNFIFATQHPLDNSIAHSFKSWQAIGTIQIPVYSDLNLRLYLYRGIAFKGYSR
jgi:hypothetical protein